MNNQRYKSTGKKSLFDEQFSADKLAEIGNPLEKINTVVAFEIQITKNLKRVLQFLFKFLKMNFCEKSKASEVRKQLSQKAGSFFGINGNFTGFGLPLLVILTKLIK